VRVINEIRECVKEIKSKLAPDPESDRFSTEGIRTHAKGKDETAIDARPIASVLLPPHLTY